MMPSTKKKISYGLARRPVQQGAGRTQLVNPVGQVSQASPGHAYWLTKRQRKNRKQRKQGRKESLPQEKPKKHTGFNILQANVEGINKKKTELEKVMNDHQVHIALLQETLHANVDLHITGYTPHPCKCGNCRGIVTYVRNDIQCDVTPLLTDCPNDILRATVWYGNKKFTIYNIYSPPKETFTFSHTESTFRATVIAGDFNGHSPLWGYTDQNQSGKNIEELCESTNLIRIQDQNSTPTLLHKAHGTLHRPDLTLISADLDNYTSKVLKDIASDHRPTLTTLLITKQRTRTRKTRWNFRKADWKKFKSTIDQNINPEEFERLDVDSANQQLCNTILKAAHISIPRGCVKKYKPFWNTELEEAVEKRNLARNNYESNPTPENRTKYKKTTAETKLVTKASKHQKWTETCKELDLRQEGCKAWKLLHNMSGDKRPTNAKPLQTEKEALVSDKKKAEHINKHFANVTKASRKTNLDRGLKQSLKEEEKKPSDTLPSVFQDELTMSELEKAMRLLKKNKSPGPDLIHNEMLMNLSPKGKEALLMLLNKTWKSGNIPKSWKIATVTPVLKKGKSADQPQSYRPISLLSCIGKVGERMINKRLYWWLESSGLISQNQAGFRAKSRTEDQLFRLTQKVIDGFQEKQHTTAIFVDLQQAYDRIWRTGLLLKMQNMGIKGNLYIWIKSFLSNRLIQTKFNSALSSKAAQEEGLPQGSSLSCTLFLIFLNDISNVIKSEKALFADDLAIWHTDSSTIISRRRLQEDLKNLEDYCSFWKLKINTSKTVYTIFTRSHKVAKKEINLTLDNKQLEKEENPTYLGVALDHQLSLKPHVENIRKKAVKRLNLIKRLASSNWGSDKQTLRGLYLGYTRSILDYNIALQNICSNSTKQQLDRIQNHALRFICGGMRTSPTSACEISANVQPLELRRQKAALDLYERAKRMEKNHPCRQVVDKWKKLARIQQKSILHVVDSLHNKHHLPENRRNIDRVRKEHSPNMEFQHPTIKTTLISKANKNTDPNILKVTTLETIDSYPKDWIQVYTDGSAFKATVNAGSGAIINFPDKTPEEIFIPCGAYCSNYVAEQQAIDTAITHISHTFDTKT